MYRLPWSDCQREHPARHACRLGSGQGAGISWVMSLMIRGSTLWRLSLGKRAQRPGVRNGLSLLPQTLASFPAQLLLLSLILPHWVSTPTISERIPVLVFLETFMLWYLMVLHCMEPGTDVCHSWSCSPSKSNFPLSVSRMLLWFPGMFPHVHLQCWYLCWYLLF